MGYREQIAIVLVALLTGCATVEYVPVPPAEPPIVVRPSLDTDYLKQGDDAGTVLKAHRVTIIKLQGYAKELETILDGYRTHD